MPSRKSDDAELSFYVGLIKNVLEDVYSGTKLSKQQLARDLRRVERSVACRGIRFLTETLPSFWKAVLSGIETGTYVRPAGFSACGKSSVLPAFMSGVLKCIFNDVGSVRPDPDPYAIQEVAQVCLLLYKLELPCSAEKSLAAINQFLTTESELRELVFEEDGAILGARSILSTVFAGFDPSDIVPRHGPGSVATGEIANQKYAFKRKFDGIHSVYPYYSYFIAGGGREILDRVRWYKSLEEVPYGTTKVILVPKDSRGPRLISSEPLEYQWIQGGLGNAIVRHVESRRPSKGFVNFTDQGINQSLALTSSLNKEFATLDLKEASDRVSVDLVRAIFPERVFRALMACRSDATLIEGVGELGLTKFAPMGSALCFPVLALTVWALSSSIASLATGKRTCYVYGDDLIVPSAAFDAVTTSLPKYGLKVNVDKSFVSSHFRESCGMDAFNGVCVTATKVKKRWSLSPRDGSAYEAYCAYLNAFFNKGFWRTYGYIREEIERLFGRVPYGTLSSGYPCIQSDIHAAERYNAEHFKQRWSSRYHRVEFRLKTVRSENRDSPISGWQRLLKDYSESSPLQPDRVVVRRATKIRRVWMAAA